MAIRRLKKEPNVDLFVEQSERTRSLEKAVGHIIDEQVAAASAIHSQSKQIKQHSEQLNEIKQQHSQEIKELQVAVSDIRNQVGNIPEATMQIIEETEAGKAREYNPSGKLRCAIFGCEHAATRTTRCCAHLICSVCLLCIPHY